MENENFNNVGVEGFKELEGVKSLFQKVNCIGEENCFVIAYNRDYLPNAQVGNLNTAATITGTKNGGIAGGVIGGLVANAVTNTVNNFQEEFMKSLDDSLKIIFNTNKYCGYLLNKTEKGIGFIPLVNDYKLMVRVEDFKTDLENYVFIKNEDIKGIEINKLPFYFSKKLLKITFNSEKNHSTSWTFPMKHKLIKYQEENYLKFLDLIK